MLFWIQPLIFQEKKVTVFMSDSNDSFKTWVHSGIKQVKIFIIESINHSLDQLVQNIDWKRKSLFMTESIIDSLIHSDNWFIQELVKSSEWIQKSILLLLLSICTVSLYGKNSKRCMLVSYSEFSHWFIPERKKWLSLYEQFKRFILYEWVNQLIIPSIN